LAVLALKAKEATSEPEAWAADSSQRLAATYHLAVEAGRAKLPKPQRQPLEEALHDVLAAAPTLVELTPLIEAVEFYLREPQPYRGLRTHEKKVYALVENAIQARPAENDLVRAGHTLLRVGAWRPLASCVQYGKKTFRSNPHFPLLEAEMMLGKGSRWVREYDVAQLLRKVVSLSRAAPDARYRPLLETVERLRRQHSWLDFELGLEFGDAR
jgi:hypothetical protein